MPSTLFQRVPLPTSLFRYPGDSLKEGGNLGLCLKWDPKKTLSFGSGVVLPIRVVRTKMRRFKSGGGDRGSPGRDLGGWRQARCSANRSRSEARVARRGGDSPSSAQYRLSPRVCRADLEKLTDGAEICKRPFNLLTIQAPF